jgi:hypothetical protein
MAKKKEEVQPEVAPVALPKGVSQELFDEIKATIISGFAAKQDPDAIKSAIFASGVPFSKLNKLYSMITTAENLVANPKDIADGISAGIKSVKLKYTETYADLAVYIVKICESVRGATHSKVESAFKKAFKENETDFPRKPAKTRGRMGIVSKTLINVFKDNPSASQDDCEKALSLVTKTPKNANDYAKMYHKMCYALVNRLSALEVLTVFSKDA